MQEGKWKRKPKYYSLPQYSHPVNPGHPQGELRRILKVLSTGSSSAAENLRTLFRNWWTVPLTSKASSCAKGLLNECWLRNRIQSLLSPFPSPLAFFLRAIKIKQAQIPVTKSGHYIIEKEWFFFPITLTGTCLSFSCKAGEGTVIIQRSPHKQRQEDPPLHKWPVLNSHARGCVFYRSHQTTPRMVYCNLVYTKHSTQKLSLECKSRAEEVWSMSWPSLN